MKFTKHFIKRSEERNLKLIPKGTDWKPSDRKNYKKMLRGEPYIAVGTQRDGSKVVKDVGGKTYITIYR